MSVHSVRKNPCNSGLRPCLSPQAVVEFQSKRVGLSLIINRGTLVGLSPTRTPGALVRWSSTRRSTPTEIPLTEAYKPVILSTISA